MTINSRSITTPPRPDRDHRQSWYGMAVRYLAH
jgi:hypothetical protein